MNEAVLHKLIEIASTSADPEAVEGVVEVQNLMTANKDLRTTLDKLTEDKEKELSKARDELDRATRTMAKLIAQTGFAQKEEPEPEPVNRTELARRLFGY